MAYAIKYQIQFTNIDGLNCSVDLLLKDYIGDITQLTGAADPFTLSYESGDDNIINPIRASECTINFYNDGLTPLTTFYSEDDEAWKIEFYSNSLYIWTGFLVQDDCREQFNDPPYQVQLKGTDNIALLKDVPFNEAWKDADYTSLYSSYTGYEITGANTIELTVNMFVTFQDVSKMNLLLLGTTWYHITNAVWDSVNHLDLITVAETLPAVGVYALPYSLYTQDVVIDKLPLMKYVQTAILKTGLVLPLQIFSNLYETTEVNRITDPTAEMFLQTHLFSGMFLNDDGTWQNCYEIIETIFFALNCTFFQSNGKWVIIRYPELRYSTLTGVGNEFAAGDFENRTAISIPLGSLRIELESNIYFINADASKGIFRPLKSTKFTFNYEQPKELIKGGDLRLLGALDHSNTIDTFRYDYYATPDVWSHLNGDTSQIVVVSDVATDTEQERYIFQPTFGDDFRYLRFNYIEVSKGDIFDFHCSFRHSAATSQDDKFHVRFLLIKPDGTYLGMTGMIKDENNYTYLRWVGFTGLPLPVPIDSVYVQYFIDSSSDDSQWIPFNLIDFQRGKFPLPEIPEDGCLLIELGGGNDPSPSLSDVEMLVKDIKLEFFYKVNQSTSIKGQTHLTSIVANPKNKLEADIYIDDSPRSPIAGTLFTSALSDFGEGINGVYFTKTKFWHRTLLADPDMKLGQITTLEREQMQDRVRAKIECTVKYNTPELSLLNVIRIDTLVGPNFIFGVVEFNYMQMTFSATLWELFTAAETDPALPYIFEYIYEQT